jgi:diguanylate cyclase (GGDEF)-like protein
MAVVENHSGVGASGDRHLHRLGFVAGILLIAILAVCVRPDVARAAEVLNVDNQTSVIDLTPFRNVVTTDQSKLTIQAASDTQATNLESKVQAPFYYWTYYSIRNASDVDQSFQIAVDNQAFVGSGILSVRPQGAQLFQALLTGPPRPLDIERSQVQDIVSFTIKPGQALGIAVQSVSPEFSAHLYRQSVFAKYLQISGFFQGLILGVTMLVFFGVLLIYGLRPSRTTMASMIFTLMAMLIILFEQGTRPPLPLSPTVIRAVIESLLTASMAFCLATFTDSRKTNALVYFLVMAIAGILVANGFYALIEPARASSVARISFALLVIAGFLLTWRWRDISAAVFDRGLFFWTVMMAWTLFAAFLALQTGPSPMFSLLLSGLFALVLIVLALELIRHAFAKGIAARPVIIDKSRKGLALVNAGHSLWDYVPDTAVLEVSQDLPRQLGYNIDEWPENSRDLFKSILDPLHLKAYDIEVEQAAVRPGTAISEEFRLCDAEGRWRWFSLRARSTQETPTSSVRCIGTLTEVTDAKVEEARLAVDALRDPVTGLANRSLFMDRLERELAKPSNPPIRVMAVEIENFKTLNESLGQENGDKLLQIAAARLLESVESDETVARLTGGQFAVLLIDHRGRRNTNDFAAALADALAQTTALPHYSLNLATNIGLSRSGFKGADAGELLEQARIALLEAHHGGNGHIIAYDATLTADRAAQNALEQDLRRAVVESEIEVYFQPICDLVSGVVAGYEALARWRHPQHGLLLPQQFIDMAERIGLIGEIGDIVFGGAARHLGIWQRVARHGSSFFVSVNISVTHLMQDGFVNRIRTVVERESLVPGTLKIEITESVIMRQPERVMSIMGQLQRLGVGLACDDFGTGFSSLASLRDLPFDTLKLDRSFIAPDVLDERSTLIISAIADMAHDLGMTLVAEGIERQEQIDVLADLGCDLGQGYLIGRAQTAKDVSENLTLMPRYVAQRDQAPAADEAVDVEALIRRDVPSTDDDADNEDEAETEAGSKDETTEAPAASDEPEALPSLYDLQNQPPKPKPETQSPARKLSRRARRRQKRGLPTNS